MNTTNVLRPPRAILFDLDGTLADTAPDLAAAINLLRTRRGLVLTPYEKLRAVASAGGRGLIGASFGLSPEDEGYPELLAEFLDNYQLAMAVDTSLFDGMTLLLEALHLNGLGWGIVTNKYARFTDALVRQIGLDEADCVISGDHHAFCQAAPGTSAGGSQATVAASPGLLVCWRRFA